MKTTRVKAIIIVVIIFALIGVGYWYMTTVTAPKKITWYAAMLDDEWELYKPIVDEYTKETGIEVEVKLYGGAWEELSEDLKAEVEAGKGVADVVTIDDSAVITTKENFEKPLGYTTFYMFIHIIIYYENYNRLRAEGGVQASGTAWRSAGGD